MRQHLCCFCLGLAVALTAAAVQGQSLADIARENRENKDASAPSKVITNADLPKDPDEDSKPQTPSPSSQSNEAANRKAAAQRAAEQRIAEQWKSKILAQKRAISNLQGQVDNLKAYFQSVNPNASGEALIYTRYQARQRERLNRLQQQLAIEKEKLEDMQEAARHAGMHTPVYDP
jgi:predicted RNase H-like nuclease (RuvC/YqgF family)